MIFEFCEGCAFNKDERCNFKYKDQLYSVKTEDGKKECNMYTTQEEFEKFLRLFDELKKEEEENGNSTD